MLSTAQLDPDVNAPKRLSQVISTGHTQPFRRRRRVHLKPALNPCILSGRIHCLLQRKEDRCAQEEWWLTNSLGRVHHGQALVGGVLEQGDAEVQGDVIC